MKREDLAELCYVKASGGRRHRVPGLGHIEALLVGHMTIAPEEIPWFEGQIRQRRKEHIDRLAKKQRIYT